MISGETITLTEGAKPPKQWGKYVKKALGAVAASPTMGAIVFGGIEIVQTGNELAAIGAERNKPCKPQLGEKTQQMLALMEKAHKEPAKSAVTPDAYGLTFLSTSKVVAEVWPIVDPRKVIETTNRFTTTNYGFETTAGSYENPFTIKTDVIDLLSALGSLPKEVAASGKVDKVVLDRPEQEMRQLTGKDNAAGSYDIYRGVISLTGGSVGAWSHEAYGHGGVAASNARHCKGRLQTYDLNIVDANPPGFAYKWEYKTGENLIVDKSVAQPYGATSPDEDAATLMETLVPTSKDGRERCAYGISDILNKKLAMSAARLDDEVPGAGQYFAMSIASRCPPQK